LLGTIITERPDEVWASDYTMTATLEEDQVTVVAAVDRRTTGCVGLHAAKKATRFEDLEPLPQAARDYRGGFLTAQRRESVTGTIGASST
jgi:hypothetical protein